MGNNRSAVVTGGAGFIGSHLVERLLADGLRVTVIDDLSTGRLANLAGVLDHPRLTFIRKDLREAGAGDLAGADWVFHLAARADIVPSIRHPLEYHAANVEATVALLEAVRAAGVGRLVYAASSSCYGIPDAYPTPETAPARPMYPYALTKYVAEHYVLHWSQVYALPAVSLRLFNVYGPRSRTTGAYGAVFGVFLAQKMAGQPFTVVGDGTQTRDFTFVTDVVDAFVRAAGSDLAGEVLNVGTGHGHSVNEIVEGLGGPVVHIPRRPGEPDRTLADATRARRLLDWEPRVEFEDGLAIMLDGIDAWREAPVWTPEAISEATKDWFALLGAGAR